VFFLFPVTIALWHESISIFSRMQEKKQKGTTIYCIRCIIT
jgi:hypothetical protein